MSSRLASPLNSVRSRGIRLDGTAHDYDALLELAKGRTFVLLGEASHGTHEFYQMRADITRRLIEEQGFDAVAVEADWPDAYRLARYVRGDGDASAIAAFGDFERFPTWMWRNHDVLAFIQWLHARNQRRETPARVGFYGMDMYSLYRSADAVIEYLDRVDPDQAAIARDQYAALDHVRDPQRYGYEAAYGLREPCREGAVQLLVDLAHRAPDYLVRDGRQAADAQFHAERNARTVVSAEAYYRAMFGSRINTWNLRDAHMVDTLLALQKHLRTQGREGRIVVWAHNSHLGDARATDMGAAGEHNVGQLVREQAGADKALLVGFTTYTGYVAAARDWDAPVERRWVRPAHKDSCEHLFYASRLDRFFLPLSGPDCEPLREPLLERAIGVIYRPESELTSHYFHTSLPDQFDCLFHLDETSEVEPLDLSERWHQREPDQTPSLLLETDRRA
jgi:erythromycin esterase-like protein